MEAPGHTLLMGIGKGNQSQLSDVRFSHLRTELKFQRKHSRLQRPRSFWSVSRIATSGKVQPVRISALVQHRKSAIHGLPVTLCMLRVKSDKSDWLRIRNDYSTRAPKILDPPRGRDSWC